MLTKKLFCSSFQGKTLVSIHQYRNGLYSWFSTPISPDFGTGSMNPELKGPPLVSVQRPGLKVHLQSWLVIPTGAKEASRPGHVGRPFSPGWYYQSVLNVFFFLFLFSIDNSFRFSNRFSNTHFTLLIIYVFYTLIMFEHFVQTKV